MVRRKWKRTSVTVREKRSNFLKCLRDLRDQIFGKFKSLEALLIIYPIYQEKTPNYKSLALVMPEAKQTLFIMSLTALYILSLVVDPQGISPWTHPVLAQRNSCVRVPRRNHCFWVTACKLYSLLQKGCLLVFQFSGRDSVSPVVWPLLVCLFCYHLYGDHQIQVHLTYGDNSQERKQHMADNSYPSRSVIKPFLAIEREEQKKTAGLNLK